MGPQPLAGFLQAVHVATWYSAVRAMASVKGQLMTLSTACLMRPQLAGLRSQASQAAYCGSERCQRCPVHIGTIISILGERTNLVRVGGVI